MSEYPSEWKVVALGEVAEVVGGGTPSRDTPAFWGNDHYWITPSEVVAIDGKTASRSREQISDFGLASSGAKLHPPGTILMTSRASIGFAAIAEKEICTNQGFQSLRCGEELDNWFALHQIRHRRAELQQLAAGSTFLEISGSNVRSFPFVVPPLPEQKKIAEILSGIDLLIRKNEKRVQKLQLSHTSLSAKAFQIELEKEQLAVALGDVVELRHGYQFRTPDFAQYGAKVIKISQVIGDGVVLTEDCDRVPWELAADKEKFRLRPGDVLMSLTGNIGRVGVVPKTDEVLLQNYRVGLFAPVDERISRKYMIHLLESRQVVSQLEDNANASAQANFGKGDLDKIMVYLPDLQKQEKTASLLSSSKDLIKAEKRKIAALQKAKLSISADLLSGRKRVGV